MVRGGSRVNFTQSCAGPMDRRSSLRAPQTPASSNQAGQYEGSVALVDDVTARTEAENRFTLFEMPFSTPIGEAVLAARNRNGTIVVTRNPAAEQLLGWRPAELIGQNGLELFAPPDAAVPEAMSFSREASLILKSQSGELSLTRRDGTQVVAHVNGGASPRPQS